VTFLEMIKVENTFEAHCRLKHQKDRTYFLAITVFDLIFFTYLPENQI
jgi:hypothetical protein